MRKQSSFRLAVIAEAATVKGCRFCFLKIKDAGVSRELTRMIANYARGLFGFGVRGREKGFLR
jgi:hypothetical protein